jgi:hypothetical protein
MNGSECSKGFGRSGSQNKTQGKVGQGNYGQKLKNDIAEVEIEIQNLTDFAPDTTQSLRPGVKGWNPTTWAANLQDAKTRLYELNIELKIAEATLKEFFGDEGAALAPAE